MGSRGDEKIRSRMDDYSGGVAGNLSSEGLRQIKHVRLATNAVMRPHRSISSRGGTHDLINAVLQEEPTSLGKFYNAAGNKVFVATDDGFISGHLERISSTSFQRQTIPWTMTPQNLKFVSANGLLVAQQKGALVAPMFFAQNNATDTWLTMTLPKPVAAVTSAVASTGAGALTVLSTYNYRIRWRYANGSSKAGPVFSKTLAGTENTITITHADLRAAASPPTGRTDYLGWTLERSKATGSVAGPFYLITDSAAAGPYVNVAADGGLGGIFARTEEVLHGEPPNLNGVIYHKNRLFGWVGSKLYVSQSVGDEEGTGIANWQGDLIYPFDKDDGDEIQLCVIQSGRLVVFKRTSTHVLEGDDLDSFRVRRIADVGAAGYRAACADGATVYFMSGDALMFRMKGDKPVPFGFVEMGHYLAQSDPTLIADALVVNRGGDFILFALALEPNDHNSDVLVYDLVENSWTHWDLAMGDAIDQKDGVDFSRSALIYVDPVKRVPAIGSASAVNPAFIAWTAGAGDAETLVQRIDPAGTTGVGWGSGVQVSNSISLTQGYLSKPSVVHDGASGAIVFYADKRDGARTSIYGQKLSAAGAPQWGAGGIAFGPGSGATTISQSVYAIPDGSGGAFVAWSDNRTGGGFSFIYVQHVSNSGAALWAADGVRAFAHTVDDEMQPQLVADGSGGVYVMADDSVSTGNQILQHLDSSGAKTAGSDGVVVSNFSLSGKIVSDGLGNILACRFVGDMQMEKFGPTGTLIWGPVSILVSGPAYPFGEPFGMVSDGSGGAFVFFVALLPTRVLVSHISSAGVLVVGPVTLQSGPQYDVNNSRQLWPKAVPMATTDFFAAWALTDGAYTQWTLYGARIDASLGIIWVNVIRPSSAVAASQVCVCTDGSGGAIVSWTEGSSGDIRATRVLPDGTTPWGASGVVIATGAVAQQFSYLVFTGAPESSLPPTQIPGYHVWAALRGATDYADASGSNGSPMLWEIEPPAMDDGHPDTLKEYERIEAHLELLAAAVSATVSFDEASPAISVPLSGEAGGLARWDDGIAKWDDGITRWLDQGKLVVKSGLPLGTSGNRYVLRLSALTSEAIRLTGHVVDARLLEDRSL